MKTSILKGAILLIMMAIISALNTNVFAEIINVNVSPLSYRIDTENKTAEVSGLESTTEEVHDLVIPDYINYDGTQIPVTSIGFNAFSSVESRLVGSLTIGDNVLSIGSQAFYECSRLNGSLTIGKNVSTIGSSAFYKCSGFTGSLILPDKVTSVESFAFYSCSGFNGSLSLSSEITQIGNSAFRSCDGFTGSLVIPDKVETIGEYAFSSCTGFKGSLKIGGSVVSIGRYAFYNCTGFTGSLEISGSVTSIGEKAFSGCTGFNSSLTIGDSVTIIGREAFSDCSGFKGSLTLSEKLTSIGIGAFKECIGLSGSLNFPSSLTDIGSSAFYNCSGFRGELVLPETLSYIGSETFFNCKGFTGSLTISDNITFIGTRAFSGCTGFNGTLTIGNSVSTIGDYAFSNSGFRGTLTIGFSVTSIGAYAFSDCSGLLGTLIIPSAVSEIKESAFSGCKYIQDLVIESKNLKLMSKALEMQGLKSITCFSVTPPECISKGVFDQSNYDKPLSVPGQSIYEYKNANEWSNFTNILSVEELPEIEQPTIEKDFINQCVKVTHPSAKRVIVSTIKDSKTLDLPASIFVDYSISEIQLVAVSNSMFFSNSQPLVVPIEFHKSPVVSYNGHTLQFRFGEEQSPIANVTLQIYKNGEVFHTSVEAGSIEVDDFGTMSVVAQSNYKFRSEPAELEVDYFNTGTKAGARNGARLKDCFGSWGDNIDGYTNLNVVGELTSEDIGFLATLPNLTTLNLDATLAGDGSFDKILSGSRIETLVLTHTAPGLLKGMDKITSVIWPKLDEKMPDGVVADCGNKNLLFWCRDNSMAPDDAANVVVYWNLAGGDLTSDESTCQAYAQKINLVTGQSFHALKPFTAERIQLAKEFTQKTRKGVCQGWETLVVPFSPTKVEHESKGDMTPFIIWDGDDGSPRPYWLYRSTAAGWMEASAIEAGVPYIISVPNNDAYMSVYNLGGNVTFSAETVTVGAEATQPRTTDWINGSKFTGTYLPVEGDILSLNVDGPVDDYFSGSAFVGGLSTKPFGAYVRSSSGQRVMPLFGDSDGVWLPSISDGNTLVVDTPTPGTIRLLSMCDRVVTIYTVSGAVVRNVQLRAGEPATETGLPAGLYIVGHEKVSVR